MEKIIISQMKFRKFVQEILKFNSHWVKGILEMNWSLWNKVFFFFPFLFFEKKNKGELILIITDDVWNQQYVIRPMEPTSSLDACKIKKRSERVCVFRVFFFFFLKRERERRKGRLGWLGLAWIFGKRKEKEIQDRLDFWKRWEVNICWRK